MIWVHFRDKMRGSSQLTTELVRRSIIRDKHQSMHILCRRSTTKRTKSSQVSSWLKIQVKTYLQKYPLPTFNLIFIYVICHCSRQHTLSYFLVFYSKQTLEFQQIWREDPRLLQSFVLELQFSYSIIFYAVLFIFCYESF